MRKQLALRDLGEVTIFSLRLVILLLVANCFLSAASAQDDDKPKDLVPPPLAVVSKGEKERLDAQTDVKKRTELAIELMDARLLKATEFSSKNQYKESLDELGGFQALLRNAFNFL